MAIGLLLAILLDQKIRAEGVLRTDLPVPDGAELHRHRHGLEVDPQPGPGPGEGDARVGLDELQLRLADQPRPAIYTVVIAGVWQSAGFVMALFLAGLRGIDDSIIKAAQIDGASLPRIYWRIIIPSLRPVFFSTLMVLSHLAIKSFDLVMALTAGGPGYATDMPATFMYAMAFSRGQIGLGAACGDDHAGHRGGDRRALPLLRTEGEEMSTAVAPNRLDWQRLALWSVLLLFAAVLPAADVRDAHDLAEGHGADPRRQPAVAAHRADASPPGTRPGAAPAPASTAAA